jgi:DNA-3-methyladenine glycosylase
VLQPGGLIPQGFYLRPVDEVARDLLGQCLVRGDVALQITEVEAYGGPEDSASHGRHGLTARNAPIREEGGRAYLYLCYGLHRMLNVVSGPPGACGAILIRACGPLAGLEEILQRRHMTRIGPPLLAGPGRVAQALGLDLEFSGHPLFESGGLELREGAAPPRILSGSRVGVDFAEAKDRRKKWRFALGDCGWVSAPKP